MTEEWGRKEEGHGQCNCNCTVAYITVGSAGGKGPRGPVGGRADSGAVARVNDPVPLCVCPSQAQRQGQQAQGPPQGWRRVHPLAAPLDECHQRIERKRGGGKGGGEREVEGWKGEQREGERKRERGVQRMYGREEGAGLG